MLRSAIIPKTRKVHIARRRVRHSSALFAKIIDVTVTPLSHSIDISCGSMLDVYSRILLVAIMLIGKNKQHEIEQYNKDFDDIYRELFKNSLEKDLKKVLSENDTSPATIDHLIVELKRTIHSPVFSDIRLIPQLRRLLELQPEPNQKRYLAELVDQGTLIPGKTSSSTELGPQKNRDELLEPYKVQAKISHCLASITLLTLAVSNVCHFINLTIRHGLTNLPTDEPVSFMAFIVTTTIMVNAVEVAIEWIKKADAYITSVLFKNTATHFQMPANLPAFARLNEAGAGVLNAAEEKNHHRVGRT